LYRFRAQNPAARTRPPKLDEAKYGRLLAKTLPVVTSTEVEYDRVAALMNQLAVIPDDQMTPEQACLAAAA
jgi:hypothetical protein